MTPRSLFNIILKILGIYFIKDILSIISELVSVFYILKSNEQGAIWTLLTIVLMLVVYSLFAYYLIFKSDWVIDKLKLEKGFNQESFPLNLHRSTILSISIIVIGGLLLADQIPNFCRQLYEYFYEMRRMHGQVNPPISYTILAASKIVIGLLLVSNQRQIVNFIERKRRTKQQSKAPI